MSRRYPTAELYEERQRDFYRNGNRSDRSYDELDLELRRGGDPRRSAPDFFHDDYNRPTAGPLVVRGQRDEDTMSRAPTQRGNFEHDSLVIRGGRSQAPPSSAGGRFDDMSSRRSEAPDRRRPREVERDETDISIRRREQSRPRSEHRDDIVFRRGDGARPRPREVEFEREEIKFRHEDRREESRPGREVEKDSLVIRNRERSLPPPARNRDQLVAREREEFVVRRREPSPPHREREIIKDEIIIRRKEERSPTPPPPPPPPPPPEPEIRPPIIQEIITHHRHIDHGVERARSPTPPPPPPSPPREDSLEISIRHRESRGGRGFEEDITFERDRSRELEIRSRGRSVDAPRRSFTAPPDTDFELEADYYNRKAMERAYPGEAYNGATKDWAIVDVPPGTNRVRMDGIGGGAQEVTWQRYNGVRRSKFISGDDQRATDFGVPNSKPKPKDMWTEITKDLVIKDAIDSMGYDYEETDYFFYVMEYLRYEDVCHLVEISDDIRRRRKSRIREIEFEREEIRDRRPNYDERYYEHEVSFDRHRHRGGYR